MKLHNEMTCCGCGACVDICPRECIKLEYSSIGDNCPVIDSSRCIDCGLCEKVCPQNHDILLTEPISCWAAYRKDSVARENSASGGIGAVLLDSFIKEPDHIVYGVCWNADSEKIEYTGTMDRGELEKYKGSKYVQPDSNHVYKSIGASLKEHKSVMFTGLPCHVAALKGYLEARHISEENLICVDLLCHGVSSHSHFTEEINWVHDKFGIERIDHVSFRSNRKERNYHMIFEGLSTKGKAVRYDRSARADPYFWSFLSGIALRENCHHCKFSCKERCGDLTIGDFIGIGQQTASTEYTGETFNTSMVLVNTLKGKELLNKIAGEITMFERPYLEAVQGGASLQKPFPKSRLRECFLEKYKQVGFIKAMYRVAGREMFVGGVKEKIKGVLQKLGIL